jgi:hypothetical protein
MMIAKGAQIETTSGVGGSNRAALYRSDIEWVGEKFREDRDSAVWSRARMILDAFDAFCEEHKCRSWEETPDGRWPSPDWSSTQALEDDDNDYVVLADANGIIDIYFRYQGPSEDDEDDGKLQRLPRCLWPQSWVDEFAENVLGDREPAGNA